MTSSFATALCLALKEHSVRCVFGMPGGDSLPMLEALADAGIQFVLCRHEGSAGFMADAIAQRTGGIGVCISTLGPGATNLVSGVAGAYLERSRVLAIVAQIEPHIQGIYTHQILQQQAIFSSICKEYVCIHPQSAHKQLLQLMRSLCTGESKPIVMELTASASKAPCTPIAKETVVLPQPHVPAQISTHIQGAKKPIFFVGCADMSSEFCTALRNCVRKLGIPVLTTYRAKGVFPEEEELSMGCCGLSPKVDHLIEQWIEQADLMILIDMDPVELRPNWLSGWDVPTISISASPAANDLCMPLLFDMRCSAIPLLQELGEAQESSVNQEWIVLSRHVKEKVKNLFLDEPYGPASMVRAIQKAAPSNTILSLDVGAHRITASHVWSCQQPRSLLQSNGFSSMGVGVPMAIATKLNEPESCSIALCGDMGFAMSMGELGIVQDHNLHLVVVYFADQSLSLIEVKQKRGGYAGGGMHFRNPDPFLLAKAFGGVARRTTSAVALEEAVQEACQGKGLWIIEAVIDAHRYEEQL